MRCANRRRSGISSSHQTWAACQAGVANTTRAEAGMANAASPGSSTKRKLSWVSFSHCSHSGAEAACQMAAGR